MRGYIEIPYRAFPERVGPRILWLESVDYFGTSDHFSGRKKKNFKLQGLLENQDRGSVKKNLKIKQINKSWISGDVVRRL